MKNPLSTAGRKTPPPTSATTPSPNLATYRSGSYNTGIPEQVVEQKAADDGKGAILDPNTVGTPNSHPHAADHLTEGHDAATGVIGHDLRRAVQAVDEYLARLQEYVKGTEAEALKAISEHLSAMKIWLVQHHRMIAAGLPFPSRKDTVLQGLRLVLLFMGDWSLIALGFQILGLSDRPMIPFIGVTDDLHLAALSSVAAIVFLGDFTGYHLRRIEHALEVRRQAGRENRDKFPKPAAFDFIWTFACFAGALAGVFSLSAIRAEYLRQMGVDASYWPFLGIQFIILAAAIGLGFAYANPEAKRWRSVDAAKNAAESKRSATVTEHVEVAANHNAHVDLRASLKAQAGHHVDTDAANVRGQHAAYKRGYIKAQLEPVQESLFAEHKVPTVYDGTELLDRLTGITPFPDFAKVGTNKVMAADSKALREIATLRARIDQIEIYKLDLPELEELTEDVSEEETGLEGDTADPAKASEPVTTPLRPVPDNDAEADDSVEEPA